MNTLDRIQEYLDEWALQYYDVGRIPPGPYYLVRTAFHGGGIVSKHRSLKGAARAALSYRISDCSCGCAEIVPVSELVLLKPAIESRSPYAAAL